MSKMNESFLSPGERTPELGSLVFEELGSGVCQGGSALPGSAHPLHGVRIELQVRVGSATMTVGELLAARENEVLALDRAVSDPVDLLLEGQVVARGELVAVGDCFGVRITQLPLQEGG